MMKKILAVILAFYMVLFTFVSCQSAEELYADKAIRVEVSHISGFETYDEYDLYFESIKKDEKCDLPKGSANSYKVDFSITEISKEGLTITFSQPMDKTNDGDLEKRELEQSSFVLETGTSQRFVTPTDGGGDVFEFTIIDKADIPADK